MTIAAKRSISDPSLTIDEWISDSLYDLLIDRVDCLTPEKGFMPPNCSVISSYVQVGDVSPNGTTILLYVFFCFGYDAKYANLPVGRWELSDVMGYRVRDLRRKFLVPLDKQDNLLSVVRDIKSMRDL